MTQAVAEKLASPEVFFLLLAFATLLIVVVMKAFFYEPRAILAVALAGSVAALLYRNGWSAVALSIGVLIGAGVVAMVLYYVIKERKSPVLRWLGAVMLASALLAALIVAVA